MRRLLLTLLLALSLTATPGCQVNPATGERQFNVLSREQEIDIGQEAAPQFLDQYGGQLPNEDIVQYVRRIGHALAEQSERPDLPWEFHVVDSATINAFALPGGKIFISRGLLARMENEAQLAGVLGHEIGHVTAQHIGQQMSRALALQAGLVALGVAAQASEEDWLRVLGVGAQVGGGLYLLSFGRDQEIEADRLGLRYMTNLGYNPVGQLQVMQILRREAAGRGAPPEFLSTHPAPETRIERLREIIREEYPGYDNPRRYSFHRDRFQQQVLQPLAELPPPEHAPDAQARQP